MTRKQLLVVITTVAIICSAPSNGFGYVGPGAGFAFVSSIFIIIFTTLLAFLTLLTWPIRWVIQRIKGSKAFAAARTRRVIVLGLDGQDPELTEQFMQEGILPNFKKLKDQGSFLPLQTTLLAESPVAWTSFQTGCNPGKHRIFDFLVPNRKSHLPELCSARVNPPRRTIPLGPFKIPLGGPVIEAKRRSQPFWKILGDHGIFSTVLRVPITFPAEKFNGVLLSAMSVPDLQGSQGTYFYFSGDPADTHLQLTSGQLIALEIRDNIGHANIPGPQNSLRKDEAELSIPIEIHPKEDTDKAELIIDQVRVELRRRKYTPWIELPFKTGLGMKVTGVVRFYLLETHPHIKLYMTPINIDPDKPALPISHPFAYAVYLSKTQGRYATLGVAEDTSALNEGVIDEDAFLEQTYLIHKERENMFFDALKKTSRGAVVCVFDITDRLQHMFFRHLDSKHPANKGRTDKHKDAIRKLYQEMDALVGQTMETITDDTVLMVMSDHGFKSFRRGVNLNSWLYKNGFLKLKNGGPDGSDMFQNVDWTSTTAYAVGFGGIYLNLAGREENGIVAPGKEADVIKQEISEGLRKLYDEQEKTHPVKEVYDSSKVYSGPYVDEAPDLIVGFRPGHRVGWLSVTGGVNDEEIEDNTRPWSGDHNFNPPDVPGMLFCNRKIRSNNPSIMDIGPTILDLFGISVPNYCDGVTLIPAEKSSGVRQAAPNPVVPEVKPVRS